MLYNLYALYLGALHTVDYDKSKVVSRGIQLYTYLNAFHSCLQLSTNICWLYNYKN